MTTTIQAIDYEVNLLQALLWQYEDAVNLKAMLTARQDWYNQNQTDFWENWFTDVFDLRTANDFGLTVWSIILGQALYVNFTSAGRPTWGFGPYHRNFNRGNFGSPSGNSVRLSTETSRILLRIRAYQLQSAGCVPEINRMLADVFADYVPAGDVPAYVEDGLDMTCNYKFLFGMTSELQFVFQYFDVLPRPAGVKLTIEVVP